MAYSAFRIVTIKIFTIILLFTVVIPVFGGGSREVDLTRADELIENREFDEAIQILSDFARHNPDKFDQAQRRLREIYRIRDDFNRTADELIGILKNDPENSEKIFELTKHLYTLEHENSPLLINFVASFRELAAFNVYRNRLRAVLERGRAALDNGDSAGAIQIYSEGMGFMRDEFFNAAFGVNIHNEVRRETERFNSLLASFQQISAQMGTIAAEYTRAVNAGELSRIPEISGRLTPAMDRFIALKQGIYISANIFDRLLGNVRLTDPNIGDRNHLAFILIVINGRTDESIQEGMLGAFDTYWENSIGAVINSVALIAERAKNASIAAMNERNYQEAAAAAAQVSSYVNLTPLFFDRHRQLLAGSHPQTTSLYGNIILSADIPRFINIRALNEANNYLQQAANAGLRSNFDRSSLVRWQEGNLSAAEALRNEQQTRNNITSLQRTIDSIISNANQMNAEINAYHASAHISDALKVINNLRAVYTAEELQSADRYYSIAHHNLQNNLAERNSQLVRSRNYLDGENVVLENGDAVVYRYPSEALQLLTVMLNAITTDLQNADSVLAQYRNEPREFAQNPEILKTNEDYLSAINELNNIRTRGLALSQTARTRSSQAEAFRQEGERLFREAQAAFQRREYDTARDRIQQADNRFNNSLEIQESASLRQMRDAQLIGLGQAISAAQNEAIIAEVRSLVNNARNSYFNGNFQQAEDNLVRARNRWRVTSPDENEEVVYWLGIVRNALSMSSERVISPTAPLYPEMSQLLSQAQRNYEEGVRLVNTGQRVLGLVKFDEARQLTREVRLMFPLNQEAGILDLRIEQFLDPAAFNATFEQRLRTAQTGTRQRSMEAFADLQNLAEINPRYPNIRAILTQAEIDIGIRPPPPNPADVARSRELTVSANRIFDSNLTAQFQIALRQLNEAIILNPENNEASRLRDRLLNSMNVPSAIVLTNEDEADYQRALREHNAGNHLVAWALVERLMQNPRNRNITKVVELQQRIQSVL